MARSIVNQDALIAKETTPGTPVVTGMKRLAGMRFTPEWMSENQQFRSTGSKAVDTVQITTEGGMIAVEGAQDYNNLSYICSSRLCSPFISTPAGGTLSRELLFLPTPSGEDTKNAYTVQWGDTTQAIQLSYAVFNSLTLGIQRSALSLGTSMIAKEPTTGVTMGGNEVQTITITGSPTGGTFTLSFGGYTTSPIAWNASAAVVQGWLELLPSIGAGNVLGAGGALPGTPVTITFQGTLARRDVALMTASSAGLTGGSSPTVTPSQTTAGATEVPSIPIASRGYDVFADDTWAGLGATKLLAAYDGNVSLGDKFIPDRPINSTITSFESLLEGETQEHTGNLRLGFDAAAVALIATFKAGSRKFLRFKVEGPTIEGAIKYLFELDLCITLLKVGQLSAAPSSPVVSLPFDFVVSKDPTSGYFIRARIVNVLTAL